MAQEDKHSEVNNSAIGSWSGFIYQGLVAVYYALTLLKENKDKYIKYSLCLDAFEDFSVHDENDQIVSLHQCKCYNASHDFKDECTKMSQKRDEYVNAGKCMENVNLYLHTNYEPKNLPSTIKAIVFNQKELLSKIKSVVTEIANAFPTNSGDVVLCKLSSLEDEYVMQIHKEYHDAFRQDKSAKLWEQARRKRLSFADVWNCLLTEELFDQDSLGMYIKTQTILQLHEYLVISSDVGDEVDIERLNLIEDALLNLSNLKANDLFQRVHPHYKYNGDLLSVANLINDATTQTLFDVLFDTKPCPTKQFDWCVKEQYETASSISATDEKELLRRVRKILQNSPNNTSLRQYDWLVGKVPRKIKNIHDEAKQFASISEDEHSIFAEKKIGIISIDDFNNENY